MTTADDSAALRFVREEITGLRRAVSQDMGHLRASLDTLARDLGKFTSEQLARVAVLERRADEVAGDVGELRAAAARVGELERTASAHAADLAALKDAQTEAIRHRNMIVAGLVVGILVAVVAAVLAALAAIAQ